MRLLGTLRAPEACRSTKRTMKLHLPLLLLLIAAQWIFAKNIQPIAIEYNHAGLTQIRIVTNHLTYITHSPSTNVIKLQSLSDYKRSESQANLTESDMQQILDWFNTNNIPAIARIYPPEDPKSYGSSFQTDFSVTLNGVRYHASWDGTSNCPEIKTAAQQLESICSQINQDRNKCVEHVPPGGRGEAPRP